MIAKNIYDSWNAVMSHDMNPLKNIPHLNTRHMIMQVLAWMWCITFSMYFSSMWVFGITAIGHILLISAIVLTVSVFEAAKNSPSFFLRKGYHTSSRSRQVMYLSGNGRLQKIELDPNDPGGEHE